MNNHFDHFGSSSVNCLGVEIGPNADVTQDDNYIRSCDRLVEASGSKPDKKLRAGFPRAPSPLSSAAKNYWGRVAAQSSNYKHYSNCAALTQHAEAGESGNNLPA